MFNSKKQLIGVVETETRINFEACQVRLFEEKGKDVDSYSVESVAEND